MAAGTPTDWQIAINDIAEAVDHMSVRGRDKEVAKSAVRAAIAYASMKRLGYTIAEEEQKR